MKNEVGKQWNRVRTSMRILEIPFRNALPFEVASTNAC
jgi:hypothetical protein